MKFTASRVVVAFILTFLIVATAFTSIAYIKRPLSITNFQTLEADFYQINVGTSQGILGSGQIITPANAPNIYGGDSKIYPSSFAIDPFQWSTGRTYYPLLQGALSANLPTGSVTNLFSTSSLQPEKTWTVTGVTLPYTFPNGTIGYQRSNSQVTLDLYQTTTYLQFWLAPNNGQDPDPCGGPNSPNLQLGCPINGGVGNNPDVGYTVWIKLTPNNPFAPSGWNIYFAPASIGFWGTPAKTTTTSSCTPAAGAGNAIVSYAVKNAITSAALTTSTTVDIIANPSALGNYAESETAASPTLTTYKYAPCQTLYYHAYSTAGNGYYDTYGSFTLPGTTSSCSNNQQCYDVTSTPILLYQRTTAANAQVQLGVGCGTFTGRSTALSSTGAGSAVGVADCSPGSGVRTVNFQEQFTLAAASTCLGVSTPFLNPIASGIQNTMGLTAWLAVNSSNPTVTSSVSTASGSTITIPSSGYQAVQPISAQPTSTTVWRTYAMSVAPLCVDPALKSAGTLTITWTLTFSTTVGVRIMCYLEDQQQWSVVNAGSSSLPPVNVGAFSGAGTTTNIPANSASYTLSSGAPTAPLVAFTINIT